jgi:hypothetical protein
MLPPLLGLCFLLSLIFTEVWVYTLFKRVYLIPPNLTLHINHLAKTRLALARGFFGLLWILLLWSGILLASSIPLLDVVIGGWVLPAILITLVSIPAILLYFYLARNTLLATWFVSLLRPEDPVNQFLAVPRRLQEFVSPPRARSLPDLWD